MKHDLSKYVVTDVSSARIARLWSAVSQRLENAPRRRSFFSFRGVAMAGAFAAAVGAAALWFSHEGLSHEAPSSWEHATLETASDALTVNLGDGSKMELGADTRVELADNAASSVELVLYKGRVDCDVVPRSGRRFVVSAAGVQVRVTGTRFSVEVGPAEGQVQVAVQHGSVEVLRPGTDTPPRQLSSGERWSMGPLAQLDTPKAEAEAPLVPAAELASEPHDGDEHGSHDTEEPTTAPHKGKPTEPASGDKQAATDARTLLDLANAARRRGDAVEAAKNYEQLLAKYPSDPRAGLAAFELGRLRMDRLGDLPGATQALRRAMAMAPGSGFREDAMARLVEAYSAMGSKEACLRAQSAYLQKYPNGVHKNAVASRCGAR